MSKLVQLVAVAAIVACGASAASAATRVRSHEATATMQDQRAAPVSSQEQAYGSAETQFDRLWDQKIQDTENSD